MKLTVTSPSSTGERLDKFLVHNGLNRGVAQDYIKQGYVKVCDEIVFKCSLKLKLNDEIVVDVPPESNDVAKVDIPIVYEDEYLLIINKPSGVLSHKGVSRADRKRYAVTDFILERYGNIAAGESSDRPGIVHRLDYKTSGLMIIAKQQDVYLLLKEMMQNREVTKKYIALVYGHISPAHGTIRNFVRREPRGKMAIARYNRGKIREAITFYSTISAWEKFSLLECQLYTGRTHQIRLHLNHAGCSVVGDGIYGTNNSIRQQLSKTVMDQIEAFDRNALHAFFLGFKHPITNRDVIIRSPAPQEMVKLIRFLSQVT